mgnify:CR=1 FL=1
MDTIEGITDSATLETSRLPEDAALPVLTGVVAFNRLLEELVVWEEAEALSEDAAVEAFSVAASVVVPVVDEPALEPQPARQPIAKAAQAMADNIFLIRAAFVFFLRGRVGACCSGVLV